MNNVQIELVEVILNNKVTSREDILINAREIISRDSLGALSIRSLAKKCGIATGSMYNYFPSKNEMILEVVLSVWDELFIIEDLKGNSFIESIEKLMDSLEKGRQKYPDFFKLHSLIFDDSEKTGNIKSMADLIKKIKLALIESLTSDSKVDEAKLEKTYTKEGYIDLIFNIILSMFMRNLDKKLVLMMVEDTIY